MRGVKPQNKPSGHRKKVLFTSDGLAERTIGEFYNAGVRAAEPVSRGGLDPKDLEEVRGIEIGNSNRAEKEYPQKRV